MLQSNNQEVGLISGRDLQISPSDEGLGAMECPDLLEAHTQPAVLCLVDFAKLASGGQADQLLGLCEDRDKAMSWGRGRMWTSVAWLLGIHLTRDGRLGLWHWTPVGSAGS